MAYQLPLFYNTADQAHEPMIPTDDIDPRLMPISARGGNRLQNLADGLYLGSSSFPGSFITLYVNSSAGIDQPANGSRATPYQSLAYALAQAAALFPNSQLAGNVVIALQCGQSFAMVDTAVWGGNLTITFYGDSQYGDFNSPAIGTGALPEMMADLNRPILTFGTNNVNAQWVMAGFYRYGGSVTFQGVQLNLPAAPATPSISLYSQICDVVRSVNYSEPGQVNLRGSIVNMTDTNAYWGFLGVYSRSGNTVFNQYGSQFQVNGITLQAANTPTTVQLNQRQYFIKMFYDLPGNNQQQAVLQANTSNSSTASGQLSMLWADAEALVVATGKTSQASYPLAFDPSYGIRNYFTNLQLDQQSRPLNVLSSRLI